jgi:hypothetical protein
MDGKFARTPEVARAAASQSRCSPKGRTDGFAHPRPIAETRALHHDLHLLAAKIKEVLEHAFAVAIVAGRRVAYLLGRTHGTAVTARGHRATVAVPTEDDTAGRAAGR